MRIHRISAARVLAPLLILSSAAALPAQLIPLFDEMPLSETAEGTQRTPAVAAGVPSSFFLAWEESTLSGSSAIARRQILWPGPILGFPSSEEIIVIEAPSGVAFRTPALASNAQGNAALAWKEEGGSSGLCLQGALLETTGAALGSLQPVPDVAGICPQHFAVALTPGLRAGLAWDPFLGTSTGTDIFYQAFAADGSFARKALNLSDDGTGLLNLGDQFEPALDTNATGQGLAVWVNEGPNAPCRLCALRLTPGGEPLGTLLSIGPSDPGSLRHPQVAVGPAPARYFVVWEQLRPGQVDTQIVGVLLDSAGRPVTETVQISTTAGDHTLPALDADPFGNFVVTWQRGQSKLLGAPAGPPEIVARLLTRFAVPRGPEMRVSQIPLSPLLGGGEGPDVAFAGDGSVLVVWRSGKLPDRGEIAGRLLWADLAPACTDDPQVLCLLNGRFQVEVEWRDFQSRTGRGTVVPTASNKSGLFWFFKNDNWELMVKMLDGCHISDHYWVFAAGTTNVEYTLTVTDTLSGQSSQYFNPLGQASPAITDTKALQVCP
jgi:hypothetical protein